MGLLGSMSVRFAADTSSFAAGVSSATNSLNTFIGAAGSLDPVVGALLGIGAAAEQMAAASVQSASEFQATMNKVQALAGVSATDANKASEAIMKMATDLGKKPQELADGLYYIASAGYNAQDSLSLLRLSTQAASVGMTDTDTVANALTATLKAMNLPASDGSKIMDQMTESVSLGKVEWADYSKVIGLVATNASQANVTFQEATSAFSILTNVMPSARQAASSLDALLQTSSRIDLLTKRAQGLGIAFDANSYQTMNFQQRLQYLQQITGGNSQELTTLLGRQNAVAAMTALATNNFKDYAGALDKVSNSSGAAQAAYDKVSGGLQMSANRLMAAWEVLKIRIGTALLPVLTALVNAMTPLVSGFGDLLNSAGPLGPVFDQIQQAFTGMGNSWKEAFAGMDTKGLMDAFKNFGGVIQSTLIAVMPQALAMLNNLNNYWIGLVTILSPLVVPVLKILGQVFQGVMQVITSLWGAIGTALMPAILSLVSAIAPVIQSVLDWIASSGLIPVLFDVISKVITFVVQAISGLIIGIALFIGWLNQGSAAANVIKVILGVLAVVLLALIAPGVLVAAVIIGAIIGILEVIKNWGAIVGWLGNLWTMFVAWFMGLWTGILAFLASIGQLLINAVLLPFQQIGQAFVWLYNHNTFVKQLVDAVVNFFNQMKQAIIDKVNFVIGFWHDVWTNALNFIGGIWNGALKLASDVWSKISGVFSSAWNKYVKAPLDSFKTSFTNFFNGIVTSAANFGGSIIRAVANGISGAAGYVGDAIHTAIQNALGNMGFHDIPGFNLPGHASGILNNPMGHFALVGEKGPEVMYVPQGASIYPNSYLSPSDNGALTGGGNGGGGGDQYITVELDGDAIMQAQGSRTARHVRIRHGLRGN